RPGRLTPWPAPLGATAKEGRAGEAPPRIRSLVSSEPAKLRLTQEYRWNRTLYSTPALISRPSKKGRRDVISYERPDRKRLRTLQSGLRCLPSLTGGLSRRATANNWLRLRPDPGPARRP